MSHSTFGHLFRVTTWGESHGPAIGCVVDGCPPLLPLEAADIQQYLDRRKPGQSRFTTQRREPDSVRILSGVFSDDGGRQVTTGTPICLMIDNVDQRGKDYADIKDKFRPGHADFTYWAKYGIRDYRGGGRSSARETAMRVAAGAIARKVIAGVSIRAALVQVGTYAVDRRRWSWEEVNRNPFFSPDAGILEIWSRHLEEVRMAGSSVGAIVEVIAEGVPAGWGAPIYGKLDQDLAGAMMSINAVKGVEIGAGMAAAELTGEENADEIRIGDAIFKFVEADAEGYARHRIDGAVIDPVTSAARPLVVMGRSIRLARYPGARYHMHVFAPRPFLRRQPELRCLELP